MHDTATDQLVAGLSCPWEYIAGSVLRLRMFVPFATVNGAHVSRPPLRRVYALTVVELPNPDVLPDERVIQVPIEHSSDFKSLAHAHLDLGVRDKANELLLVYEPRRGFFGGKKACLHVVAYPAGTWDKFFDAVSHYAAQEFVWPKALFLYQPSHTRVFPATSNCFQP
jgi:hypothetical protein